MPLEIGFLVFPQVQQLDLTGPYEVFASLPDVRMHLIGASLAPVVSATGLLLTPTTTYRECPALDVLCVPGGAGVNALMTDPAALDFVRAAAGQVRFLTSVCTGALVLGAAGLLRGKRATTHWAAHDLLAKFGAVPVKERVVRDGTLFTGGGVTAGIDFALTVAAELVGTAGAQEIQLHLEYAPAPPFDAGTPELAPADVVTAVRAKLSGSRAKREAIVASMRYQ